MTTLKGQEELDQYKLTKREVADLLGISTNAVRMSMRGNNCHNLEYRFNGKQFLFKIPRRDMARSRNPDLMVRHNGTPKSTLKTTLGRNKKIYNRGATHRGEAKYVNNATRMYNEGKILKNIEDKFESPEHKKAFNEMTEAGFKEALEISRRAKLKGLQENLKVSTPDVFPGNNPNSFNQSHSTYGTMLNAQGIAEGDRKALEQEDKKYEQENKTKYKQVYQNSMQLDGTVKRELVNTNTIDFGSYKPFQSTGCYWESDHDRKEKDGGIEITQYEIDRSTPIQERTSFDSKVEESIYRAKKHLLKTRGGWD